MKMQKEMEAAMLTAHRQFVSNLEKGLEILEKEMAEAGAMTTACTDEWCKSTDHYIDELHKDVYAISEPRFATGEDSRKLKELRRRVKDLYARFQGLSR
ncbi:MAG: hypothetical protein AB1568_14860 [Thermodesulfobacteriota bacterium]